MFFDSYQRLAAATAALTLLLIVLGAWVRLTDAGLGCPDWPGCYGQMTWPASAEAIASAAEQWPEAQVDPARASREMIHRYVAPLVALGSLALAAWAWRRRRRDPASPVWLATALLPLLAAQIVLGMLTVTWLVKPAVVTLHLAGGLATWGLLLLIVLANGRRTRWPVTARTRHWLWWALLAVGAQILLGGWTSTNYAALACPDFPTCQQSFWPPMDFHQAFVLWRGLGVDYQGGVLDPAARTAIHVSHRLGALIVLLVSAAAAWRLIRKERLRAAGAVLLALVGGQIVLGILNVAWVLPLATAVAHTAGAALLLGWLTLCLYRTRPAAP